MLTRRALLRLLLAGLGLDEVWRPPGAGRAAPAGSVTAPGGPAPEDAPASPLTDVEREDLLAFAEIVVEGRPLDAERRAFLVEFISDRLALGSEHLDHYRTTAGLLERLAGQRFARLPAAERLDLVARHRLGVVLVHPDESLGPLEEEIRVVRRRVVRDLIGGYYASPAGWAIVGYSVFPGRCGDLDRYTRGAP